MLTTGMTVSKRLLIPANRLSMGATFVHMYPVQSVMLAEGTAPPVLSWIYHYITWVYPYTGIIKLLYQYRGTFG